MIAQTNQYRHNHYVPVWYQRRFMLPGQDRYYRLDLKPDVMRSDSVRYARKNRHHWSPERIFAQNNLYTLQWGDISNTDIERFFFGRLDREGCAALDYFDNFTHPSVDGDAFHTFLSFMSVQKLRTPKGLASLAELARVERRDLSLMLLQRVQNLFCAIWTECVWQIVDAGGSPTKFIISDHPVTVYNRACPHLSKWCLGHRDPDIRMHATQTLFPLSLNKALVLTNLSWVRNPYQRETEFRPNPNFFRDAMFNFTAIQTGRKLSEDEVLQMNLVTKRRAFRYIAAAKEDWLFPERRVSTDYWKKLGGGYLFMPEPRLLHLGGQVVVGYEDGTSAAYGEYGHRPWQKGYEDKERDQRERLAFRRFQAEWAIRHGQKYTAQACEYGGRSLTEDSDEMMVWRRRTARKYRRRDRCRR